jgi:hypothetical protein
MSAASHATKRHIPMAFTNRIRHRLRVNDTLRGAACLVLAVVLAACGSSGAHGTDAGVDGSDARDDGGDATDAEAASDVTADATEVGEVPRETPTTLVPARDASTCTSMDLAIVGATLFWSDETRGEVRRVSVTGGEPVTIASGEDHPKALVVRGGRAFWMAGPHVGVQVPGNPRAMLRSAQITGGAVATVVAPAEGVTGFTSSPDGQTLYFGVSTSVRKISAAGSGAAAVEVARDEVGTPFVFALDGSILSFITDITGAAKAVQLVDGDVATCVKGNDGWDPGHRCVQVGRASGTHTLADQDGRIYWEMAGDIKTAPIKLATPNSQMSFVEAPASVQATAISGRTLVFTAFDVSPGESGVIGEAPLDGASPSFITLADGENRPGSIVTDGARAYWSTADCAIRSVGLR